MKLIKICALLLLSFCKAGAGLAQKKHIDQIACSSWSSLEGAAMNHTGKYVSYTVENEPAGHKTFVFRSTENAWNRSFTDIGYPSFLSTKKANYAIALDNKDRLMIISLGSDEVQYVDGVKSFSLYSDEKSDWIAYQEKSSGKLCFQNMLTGKKYEYQDVIHHVLADDGQTVILQTEKKVKGLAQQQLSWMKLGTAKNELIWEGLKAESITLDIEHHQLAFINETGLFVFRSDTHQLTCLLNSQNTPLYSGLKLAQIRRFSNDGARLFIDLKEEDKPSPLAGAVEVWSYMDLKLQTAQENEAGPKSYIAVVDLRDGKVIRVEQKSESLSFNSAKELTDTIGIISHDGQLLNGRGGTSELVSLNTGKRTFIKTALEIVSLSPLGKYLICFDPEQHAYVSYNTRTEVYQNISGQFSGFPANTGSDPDRLRVAGWLKNDEAVLFYDAYDIWKLDVTGKEMPVNLTHGYGRRHHLMFSITYGQYYPYLINKDQKLVLAAFDLNSKKQGFYSLMPGKAVEPQLLSMGNYFYGPQDGIATDIDKTGSVPPIKAKDADVYLVSRMSAHESLNYFSTRDFKTFKGLSDIYPERDYNWYKTELHTWTSLDGRTLQGVLYKPENFDPAKKYPVIIHYYESKSNNLNVFIKPEILSSFSNVDIPTYVDKGYLIFTPDIEYKIGDPMQGTYDAVVSAAKYIGALPFVNAGKMGIQGCSWGGVQTNYLVTHTNMFAAAVTCSSMADWIAHYGKLRGGGPNLGNGQLRMEKSIWEIPGAYIKNSPIFQLHKVTTPLLVMHTKKDDACAFDNALELFIGLRQLGKKSWMLVYSEGDHGLWGKEAEDFSVRMMQFFDHYLKDKPAPVWMTRGISADRKGLDNGFEYDAVIKTPGPGLLAPAEQKVADSLLTRKPIVIELK